MTTASSKPLQGIVPPVCTPLTPDWEIDVPSLERLVDHLLEAGVHGLFVLGSTSEVAFLPDAHRLRVLETVIERVAGAVPVLAGAIDMTTMRVLEHAKLAQKAGCDGLVTTAPFYTRTHPAEIELHLRTVAGSTELPVYAYDLPVSVHSKLSAEMLLRLAGEGVLAGVKDSSGDDAGLRQLIIGSRETEFGVFTGSELLADSALWLGADGIVPGLGNLDPHGYVRLYEHCTAGDWQAARTEQERLLRLFRLTGAGDTTRMGPGSSALGAFKAGLYLRGIIEHPVTAPPQIQLNAEEIEQVRRTLATAGLL